MADATLHENVGSTSWGQGGLKLACSFLWCGRGNAHIETAGLVGRTTGKSQRRITLHQGTEHTSPNAHTPPCLARAVSYEDAYRSTLPRAPSAPASHLPSQNRRSFVTTQGMTTGGIRPRSRIYVHYARFEALFTNFRFLHAAPPAPPSPSSWVPTCQFSSYFIILLLVTITLLLFTIHYRHPRTPPASCRCACTP